MNLYPLFHILLLLASATLAVPLPNSTGDRRLITTPFDDAHDVNIGVKHDSTTARALLQDRGRTKNKSLKTQKKPVAPGSQSRPPPSTDRILVAHTYSLRNDIDDFDMRTTFRMAKPAATGTRNLSDRAMQAVPMSLTLQPGSFDPKAIIDECEDRLIATTAQQYDMLKAIFMATKGTKAMYRDPVAGEGGLSHMLYQQVGGPINQILMSMGSWGLWTAKAKGTSPIEDWQFLENGISKAVLELKTPDSLPRKKVEQMVSKIAIGNYTMSGLVGALDSTTLVKSLVDKGGNEVEFRAERKGDVLALEQVIAQMYTTSSPVGALTSAVDWLVLEATGTDVTVTRLPGTKPNGQSNVLDILLAMSLKALASPPLSPPAPDPNSIPATSSL